MGKITNQQQKQKRHQKVLVAKKGYELVDGLGDFQIPKQYTIDGREIWAKEEGVGEAGGISGAAVELLPEYPRPKQVYSAVSTQSNNSSSSRSSRSSSSPGGS